MASCLSEALDIRPLMDTAFSYEDSTRGVGCGEESLGQSLRGCEIHLEGLEIPIVDPNDSGTAAQRPLEFRLVMNFDQSSQSGRIGEAVEV